MVTILRSCLYIYRGYQAADRGSSSSGVARQGDAFLILHPPVRHQVRPEGVATAPPTQHKQKKIKGVPTLSELTAIAEVDLDRRS